MTLPAVNTILVLMIPVATGWSNLITIRRQDRILRPLRTTRSTYPPPPLPQPRRLVCLLVPPLGCALYRCRCRYSSSSTFSREMALQVREQAMLLPLKALLLPLWTCWEGSFAILFIFASLLSAKVTLQRCNHSRREWETFSDATCLHRLPSYRVKGSLCSGRTMPNSSGLTRASCLSSCK